MMAVLDPSPVLV